MTITEELQQLLGHTIRTKLSLERLFDHLPVSHQLDLALVWAQATQLADDLQELKFKLDAAEDN